MSSENVADALLAAARDLPRGDDAVWEARRIIWKEPATWAPALTAWLAPDFRADAMRRLRPGSYREICWDDSDWLEVLGRCIKGGVEDRILSLGMALLPAIIRTYHGCRTEDAGSYFRHGLLVHRRARLEAEVLQLIEHHPELACLAGVLDQRIAQANDDEGLSWVVLSDDGMLRHSAHYLIYGSEWKTSVMGGLGDTVMKRLGTPTFIEIDLPLAVAHSTEREQLARVILREWTRLACNGAEWVAPIDFSFRLAQDVPAAWVVDHSHPESMNDPLNGERLYRSPTRTCKFCATR